MVVPSQPLPRHGFTLPLPLLSVQEGSDFANQVRKYQIANEKMDLRKKQSVSVDAI